MSQFQKIGRAFDIALTVVTVAIVVAVATPIVIGVGWWVFG